jgi:vacuolar-type H+-ATPase subunit H|tara:strand:+ start:859 stop:1167 length:309 start_codon:yes stop_codon:yes gene_type:complete
MARNLLEQALDKTIAKTEQEARETRDRILGTANKVIGQKVFGDKIYTVKFYRKENLGTGNSAHKEVVRANNRKHAIFIATEQARKKEGDIIDEFIPATHVEN